MFVWCILVSTHLLLLRGQDCVKTNTGKYISVSKNEYKIYDKYIPTDEIIKLFFITLVSMSTNDKETKI